MTKVDYTPRNNHLLNRLHEHTSKQLPTSVIIVANGDLGFTVSVRYEDLMLNKDFSSQDKEEAYFRIGKLFRRISYGAQR